MKGSARPSSGRLLQLRHLIWLCNPLGCEHAQSQSSTTLPASTTLPVVQSCKLPRPVVHCLPVLYCLPTCVCVSHRLQIVGTSLYSSSDDHQDLKQQSKHIVTGGLGSVIDMRKVWLLTRSLEFSWVECFYAASCSAGQMFEQIMTSPCQGVLRRTFTACTISQV